MTTNPDPVAGATIWRLRGSVLSLDTPLIMGILNVTPDSFSDGGSFTDLDTAIDAGRRMITDGAALVDVGGESTRPGAEPVSVVEELERVLPVIEGLSREGILVSIDTSKPVVAREAIEHGAVVVNDVTGLRDQSMRALCAETGVGVVIMHMLETPETMQDDPRYGDVVSEVSSYLSERVNGAVEAGISHDSIIVDPGIGFGKTYEHNIELMANLRTLSGIGSPLLLGTSRKGFLGRILDPTRGVTEPIERDNATAATLALAVLSDVSVLRVHNVPSAVDVVLTVKAIVPKNDGKETDRA